MQLQPKALHEEDVATTHVTNVMGKGSNREGKTLANPGCLGRKHPLMTVPFGDVYYNGT